MPSGTVRRAVSAISHRVTNIAISTPPSMMTEEISVLTLWFSVCPMVSTSLVTRESTSP